MTKKQSTEADPATNPDLAHLLPAEDSGLQLAFYDGPSMGIATMDDVAMIVDSLDVSTTEWKLPRAKLPSGSGDGFQMTVLGNTVSVPEVTGAIVGVRHAANAWWRTTGSTAGSFPSCKSDDGIMGYGVNDLDALPTAEPESHPCGSCAWNKMGTKRLQGGGRGAGKDCKNTAILLVLLPDDLLPTTIVVPPGSLTNWGEYKTGLLSKRLRVSDVVTRFGLEGAVSTGADGSSISYKKITFKAVGRVEVNEVVKATRAFFSVFLNHGTVLESVGGLVGEALDEVQVEG